MFEKPAEDEQQWLSGLDLMIELVIFDKSFRRLNQFKEPGGGAVSPFPESDGFRAEPVSQLLFIKSSQLPEGMDSPLVENAQDFGS